MKFLQVLPGLVALAFLSGCHHEPAAMTSTGVPLDGPHNAAELAGKAESGLFANATLATLGSFEWDVAPIINKAADVLTAIPLALKKGEMSKQQAQTRLDAADKAHDLAQEALKACKQGKDGKCHGSESKARTLLDQAKAQLAGL
jgi:hypothetical protein